jgi:hypothetical protein
MNIKCDVVKVLKEVSTHDDYKWQIRIVRWNDGGPQLEKRQFHLQDDGDWRPMKAKGFGCEDVMFIQENMSEILLLLGIEQ